MVLAPKVLKAAWREFGIAHGRLDAAVTEIALQRARICAPVRERVAAGMAQHVWMYLEANLGRVAGARDQFSKPGDRERCAPL
jgi:hypothetical protein